MILNHLHPLAVANVMLKLKMTLHARDDGGPPCAVKAAQRDEH